MVGMTHPSALCLYVRVCGCQDGSCTGIAGTWPRRCTPCEAVCRSRSNQTPKLQTPKLCSKTFRDCSFKFQLYQEPC